VKRWLARGVIVLALGLLTLEISLQMASLVAPGAILRTRTAAPSSDAITILCVGDSHTFGAAVPPEQSYPAQLQEILTKRYPRHVFDLVNLGVPGMNSASVANRLARQIVQFRPHVVIVWVGVNNIWNALETEAWGSADYWTALRRILLRSKVFRLASVFWYTRTGYQYALAEGQGNRQLPDEEGRLRPKPYPNRRLEDSVRIRRGIQFDLERMAATTQGFGTAIIFVNYPVPYRVVNRTIQITGRRLGVPVVETVNDVWRAKRDGHPKSDLMMMVAGPHPKGLLYGYVAESIVPRIVTVLKQWHGVHLSTDSDELAAVRTVGEPAFSDCGAD
jgi:hypothetical protein